MEIGDLCKNFYDIHISLFFLVFNHNFIIDIDFTHTSQLRTQQLMMSQIRSHIEHFFLNMI